MVDSSFPKTSRLLSTQDFQNLREKPFILKGRYFRIFYKSSLSPQIGPRLGLSVSKKVGRANKRNLVKRILREEFRKSIFLDSHPRDILVVASPFIFKSDIPRDKLKVFLCLDFKKLLKSIS